LKEARIILELAAIELACERRNEADIARMRQSNDSMLKATIEDGDMVLKYSMDFHSNIFQASGNRFLISIMACMANPLFEGRELTFETNKERYNLAFNEHNEMIDAIVARDAEKAKALMRNHLQTAYY
jgi:DNA-binding FadR family transcriptional regulator